MDLLQMRNGDKRLVLTCYIKIQILANSYVCPRYYIICKKNKVTLNICSILVKIDFS